MSYKKNYITVADLLTDDGFLAWYLKTNEMCVRVWNQWINENSKHAQLTKKAVKLLSVILSQEKDLVPQQQISESFEQLHKKIIIQEEDTSAYTNKKQ